MIFNCHRGSVEKNRQLEYLLTITDQTVRFSSNKMK